MKHRILNNGAVEVWRNYFYYPSASPPAELLDEIKTKQGQYNLLHRLLKHGYSLLLNKLPKGVKVIKSDVSATFSTPKRLLKYVEKNTVIRRKVTSEVVK